MCNGENNLASNVQLATHPKPLYSARHHTHVTPITLEMMMAVMTFILKLLQYMRALGKRIIVEKGQQTEIVQCHYIQPDSTNQTLVTPITLEMMMGSDDFHPKIDTCGL